MRIDALDRQLGSYALVLSDQAIADARHAEKEIAAGHYRGPLHGVPLGVKDLLWTQGIPTAAGMPIHANFRPAATRPPWPAFAPPARSSSASSR